MATIDAVFIGKGKLPLFAASTRVLTTEEVFGAMAFSTLLNIKSAFTFIDPGL